MNMNMPAVSPALNSRRLRPVEQASPCVPLNHAWHLPQGPHEPKMPGPRGGLMTRQIQEMAGLLDTSSWRRRCWPSPQNGTNEKP